MNVYNFTHQRSRNVVRTQFAIKLNILKSTKNEYINWSGRCATHMLLQHARWPANAHSPRLFLDVFRNCIDPICAATHHWQHFWNGESGAPSVTCANFYSHPWHCKDSWWVVHRFGAHSQSSLESIDGTKRKLSHRSIAGPVIEGLFFTALFFSFFSSIAVTD